MGGTEGKGRHVNYQGRYGSKPTFRERVMTVVWAIMVIVVLLGVLVGVGITVYALTGGH